MPQQFSFFKTALPECADRFLKKVAVSLVPGAIDVKLKCKLSS